MRQLVILLSLLLASSVEASVLRVPDEFATIQEGINAAVNGDTVLVGPGVYYESLTVGKGICLKSLDGPDATIIHPSTASSRIIDVSGSRSLKFTLSGFTISEAFGADDAIGIFGQTCSIENNWITDNNQCNSLVIGSPIGKVTGNRIWNNSGGICSGIWVGSPENMEISHNEIFDNSISNCPGIRVDGGVGPSSIHHNLLYGNSGISGSYAVAINVNGIWKVYNNTVVSNQGSIATTAVWLGNASIDVRNNIVAFNQNCSGIRAAYLLDYNDSWQNELGDFDGCSLGDGNFSLNPLFADEQADNYELTHGSPCIDAGDPATEYVDFDGTRNDLGARPFIIESYPIPYGINYGDGLGIEIVRTLIPTIYWSYLDTGGTVQNQVEIEVGTDTDWSIAEMWQPGPIASPDTSLEYSGTPLVDHRRYHVRMRVNNGANWGVWIFSSFVVKISRVIRVPQDQPTIQEGIWATEDGDTVLVGPGTYYESLVISRGIILLSDEGPEVTVIHPVLPSSRIIDAGGIGPSSFTLSGFTLSDVRGADYAIFVSRPTYRIENNYITNNDQCSNVVIDGGTGKVIGNRIWNNSGGTCCGIWIKSGVYIEVARNEIFENSDSPCAGIRTDAGEGPSSIHHNLLYGNSNNSNVFASVLNINGNWMVYNNSVIGNGSSTLTAALWVGGSSVHVRNNIICSNQNCWGIRGASNLAYNDSWDNELGDFQYSYFEAGNFSLNPLFADQLSHDFNLTPGSPCVDAGDPSTNYNDPDGSRNDIGALALILPDYPVPSSINFGEGLGGGIISTLTPTIYWSYLDTAATIQEEFEIEVGTDADWSTAELWQLGPISSQDTVVQYDGLVLEDQHRFYIRIRVNNGLQWGGWVTTSFLVRISRSIRVPQDASTIQAGVDLAVAGDTVLVFPGVYDGNITIMKRLTLASVSGADSTIIESSEEGTPLLTFSALPHESLTVSGFGFTGARTGGCALCLSGGVFDIQDNKIYDNEASVVLQISNSTGIIRSNQIYQNKGTRCAGILVESDVTALIEKNVLSENESAECGGIRAEGGTGTLKYNLLFGNTNNSSGYASTMNLNGQWGVYNNTLAMNVGNRTTAALWIGSVQTDVRNNIVAFNSGCYGIRWAEHAAYNCSFGNQYQDFFECDALGPGNLNVDPQFDNATLGDFELLQQSPCRDAGDPDESYIDPDSTRNDMGALPSFEQIRIVRLRILDEPDLEHVVGNIPTVAWEFRSQDQSDQMEFEIAFGTDTDWQLAELWNPAPFLGSDTLVAYDGTPLANGQRYWFRLRARSISGWSNWYQSTIRLNSPPSTPQPYEPGYGNSVISFRPYLTVVNSHDDQSDSLYYIFEVSLDSLMTDPIVMVKTQDGSTTSAQVTVPLLENGRYFWRATAADYYEASSPTPLQLFWVNTANSSPLQFFLSSPPNRTDNPIGTRTPVLSWEPAQDPDPLDSIVYTLYMALDINFHFVSVTPGIRGASYQVTTPLYWKELYWWKVKATDIAGIETWCSQPFRFRTMTPGDPSGDGTIAISDVVYLINFIFSGGRAPNPLAAGDANCSGGVNISDAVYLIQYIFAGGPVPCEELSGLKKVDPIR